MLTTEEIKNQIGNIDYIGDYKLGYYFYSDRQEPTNLPTSDVVKFFLQDHSTITVRPSGTEPKLKIYLFANGEERLNALKEQFEGFIK